MAELIFSFSVVAYKNKSDEIQRLFSSVQDCGMPHRLTLIDNGSDKALKSLTASFDYDYVDPKKNLGFGAAHNIVLKKNHWKNPYHVVINPDVYFDKDIFKKIFQFLEENNEVGACVPKVLYPNSRIQHLCKFMPKPSDLFFRRFLPNLNTNGNNDYELKNYDYNQNLYVPILSGSCLVIRDEVLEKVGYFDERFFLYLEDVDFCRRIGQHFDTRHFAEVSIFHEYEKGSYKNKKNLKLHLLSAVKYFNKWGWFFDSYRKKKNQECRKKNQPFQLAHES